MNQSKWLMTNVLNSINDFILIATSITTSNSTFDIPVRADQRSASLFSPSLVGALTLLPPHFWTKGR